MTRKKVRKILLSFALLLTCLITCLFNIDSKTAFASNITINGSYSDVIDDLQTDEEFDADSYKIDQNDYSLQVITIAESSENELFIYVYQPCTTKNIVATTINFSTTTDFEYSPNNYKLRFVNSRGVFYKYVVENFVVSSNNVRHYEISSIFRSWRADLGDTGASSGTISEISFGVGKLFTFTGTGKDCSLACSDVDVITVTDKYVGFVRYPAGFSLLQDKACDAHFVAFNTDKDIDKLYEADLIYSSQSKTLYKNYPSNVNINDEYGSVVANNKVTLTYTDKVVYEDGGLFSKNRYEWNRIDTVEHFLQTENYDNLYKFGLFNVSQETRLSESGINDVKGKKWILRFAETDYSKVTRTGVYSPFLTGLANQYEYDEIKCSTVSDVSILRLKFETDGVVYNLGVVDNKQTGDGVPDNYTTTDFDLTSAGKTLLAILGFILLLLILWPLLPLIFQFFGWLIKGIWKIICLPFTAIKSATNKTSNNQKSQSVKKPPTKTKVKKVSKKSTDKNKK